ncbi:MAG: thioredoxin domain-containing protein, partial [Balneolaceae bacterium]
HESFEDEDVAEKMNREFVNIKVDREERPDIDHTYMTICQMLTGRGGWPLTIIMTPDKEPFFGATYIPKNSRHQMIGMMDLIPQIGKVWKQEPERIKQSVEKIKEGFGKSLELGRSDQPFNDDAIKQAKTALRNQFDEVHGGFGGSPKFPSPHNLLFLMRYQKLQHTDSNEHEEITQMIQKTCREMRLGGIWDHIGGGFHRYSTDEKWLFPHFEKMLYDQATLLLTYSEAWKISGNELFKTTCYQLLDYINEQLTSNEGGLYSAEDADSEGEEGKFYVWTSDELKEILPPDQFSLFCDLYQIKEEGNFKDEATHQLTGKNVPHLKKSVTEFAIESDLDPETVNKVVQKSINSLKEAREKRVRPQLDDKILTDWNGLMMAALATAGSVFKDDRFTEKSKQIVSFLKAHCFTEDHKLLHRCKDGEAGINGMADDYAFTIWGLIELYQTTFDADYLQSAINLHQTFTSNFWDDEHGGFHFTPEDGEELLGRQKEIYDGAIPSSNSVAALNAFRLARLTGNTKLEEQSDGILNTFAKSIHDAPAGYTFALITPLLMQSNPVEVVITCKQRNSTVDEITSYLQSQDRFRISIVLKTEENAKLLKEISPFSETFPVENRVAVYICRNFTCETPVYSLEDVKSVFE